MPSLLAAIINQYRSLETGAIVDQLFTTGRLPNQVTERFGDGYSSIQWSFGYALAEAVGKRSALALSQGMPVAQVGERMAEGLMAMGPSFMAYGIDVLKIELTRADLPNVKQYLEGQRDLTTGIKKQLAQAMAQNPSPDFSGLVQKAMVTSLSDFDKVAGTTYTLAAHHQAMDQSRADGALPLLDLMRQTLEKPAQEMAGEVFARRVIPQDTMARQYREFTDTLEDSAVGAAARFALAEALAVQAVDALEKGQPLAEVGALMATGMKEWVRGEHLAYGVDHLKFLIGRSAHPTLKALSTNGSLSTDAKEQLLTGMRDVLSPEGLAFLLEVLTDVDKINTPAGLQMFRQAVDQAYPPGGRTPVITDARAPTVKATIPALTQLKLGPTVPAFTPDLVVLNDEQLHSLFGGAPQDPAFQALSDRLVNVAQRQRTQVLDSRAWFTTLGGMVGLAHDMNGLDVPATMHLVNRVLAALAPDGRVVLDDRAAFLKGMDDTGFLQGALRDTLLNRLSNVDRTIPSRAVPSISRR